ncbi:hypothetical protein [Herbaspirillum sp. NPDC087042]|uniref:hypothetical protein n=1 Tax=Herbaspirillum sp. NPDC087042 TaxID=3364004 RepID=UPI0038244CDA
MTKTILGAAILATATLASGAYAQSYDQGGTGMQAPPQQQYDSSPAQPQYYNYQGEQTSPPAGYQESGQNGQYMDHKGYEMPSGRPNNYARELKDGPMGTSPGA